MAQTHGLIVPATIILWAGLVVWPSGSGTIPLLQEPTGAATETPLPTGTDTPPPTDTAEATATETGVPTASSTPTDPGPESPTLFPTGSPSPSPSAEASPTSTATPTASSTSPPEPAPASLRINEVAWAGTLSSAFDEWIELYNYGPEAVDLNGWRLTDGGDVDIPLAGRVPSLGFFLLERTDDSTISDVAADQIYTGGLSNTGEALVLISAAGSSVDTANHAGGAWPAGDSASRASMARRGTGDEAADWGTSAPGPAHDASGLPVAGSPRAANAFTPPPATHTPTASPSPTPSPPASPSPAAPGSVLINEVAWAGTRASTSDEWIELYNVTDAALSLAAWRLTDGNDLDLTLDGIIPASGYYLLERTDDQTIGDIPADQIYSGGLSNSGETLTLMDATGRVIDAANQDGGAWPAGDADGRASMERKPGSGGWATFTGYFGMGHDASGQAIRGTPKGINSQAFPTPTATWIPGALVINEVLIRPHYDWEGTGGVSTADEFIELYNRGPGDMFLKGWWLDDISDGGSQPHDLPAIALPAQGRMAFFRSRLHIALNDGGDSVRLLSPDGRVIDQISYLSVRTYNLSYGRLPDGSNHLAYGLWPTPGEPNVLFVEPDVEPEIVPSLAPHSCPAGGLPWPRLSRLARRPEVIRWWWSLGLGECR